MLWSISCRSPTATDAALGVVQAGDGIDVDSDGVISVVARLEEIDELPTAAAALEGKIYLLTATQTGYDRGGIYMCEESTETAGAYEWKLISMSPLEAGKGITIENDVISADTNIFNGTLDEWEALTTDEQAKYDYVADNESADANTALYFANQIELSDWETITIGTTNVEMEYDGIIVGAWALDSNRAEFTINNTIVIPHGNSASGNVNINIPVKKGDLVKQSGSNTSSIHIYARFYKKRDYSLRA